SSWTWCAPATTGPSPSCAPGIGRRRPASLPATARRVIPRTASPRRSRTRSASAGGEPGPAAPAAPTCSCRCGAALRPPPAAGAFAGLRARHRTAATRLAAGYRPAGDPEDLVAEAFEEALSELRRGAGPRGAFRAHLFVTLRRVAADRTAGPGDAALDELPGP